jgi:hypothetical protein
MGKGKEPKLYFGDDSKEMKESNSNNLNPINETDKPDSDIKDKKETKTQRPQIYSSEDIKDSINSNNKDDDYIEFTQIPKKEKTLKKEENISNKSLDKSDSLDPRKKLKENILRSIKKNHADPNLYSDESYSKSQADSKINTKSSDVSLDSVDKKSNSKKNLKELIMRSMQKDKENINMNTNSKPNIGDDDSNNQVEPKKENFRSNLNSDPNLNQESKIDESPNSKKNLKELIMHSMQKDKENINANNNSNIGDNKNNIDQLNNSNNSNNTDNLNNNHSEKKLDSQNSETNNTKKMLKEKILSAMKGNNSNLESPKVSNKTVIDNGIKSIQFDSSVDMRNLKKNLTKNLFLETNPETRTSEHEEKIRLPTGINGFDELIEGGFIKDSTILVKGGPGSGKSIFAMQYLINGIEDCNENGVYISFEQEPKDLIESMEPFNWNLEEKVQNKKLALLYFSP